MRTVVVVLVVEPADDHLGLEHAVEHLAVEELAAHGAVEPLDVAVLLRGALLDPCGRDSFAPSQVTSSPEMNSLPLSDRITFGAPCSPISRSTVRCTERVPDPSGDVEPDPDAGYSLTTLSSRSGLPSSVRSDMKSYDQM